MSKDELSTLKEICDLPALEKKVIQELYEVSANMVYDGIVDDEEIAFLGEWLKRHGSLSGKWPLSRLYSLLQQVLQDGKIEEAERLQLLMFLSGLSVYAEEEGKGTIFDGNPAVHFAGRSFLFIGELEIVAGSRVNEEVVRLGGRLASSSDSSLDYLVVGNLRTPDWRRSGEAPLIQRTIDQKRAGVRTLIIRETDFVRAVIQARS